MNDKEPRNNLPRLPTAKTPEYELVLPLSL